MKILIFTAFLIAVAPHAIFSEEKKSPDLTIHEQEVIFNAQKAIEKRDFTEAEALLQKYFDSNETIKMHYLVYFTMGNVLLLSEKHGQAIDYYKKAHSIYPGDPVIWQNMGRAFYSLKRYNEAGDSLKQAYQLTGTSELALHSATAYLLGGSHLKTLALLEPMLSDDKVKDNNFFELLLRTYMEMGDEEKAIDCVWKILSKDNKNPGTWKILASLYMDNKNYSEAAAAFSTYTSLSSSTKHEDLKLLCDLYRLAGAPLRAAMGYEKLLDDEADQALYEITAATYMEAYKPEKAIEILKKGIKIHSSLKMQWMLAVAYYKQRDFASGADAFEKCAMGDFRRGEAYLMMGYCFLYADNPDKAKSAFKQASLSKEQKSEALKRLKEIREHENKALLKLN
ncbi:MAG: tetratricopeptide repeat protein [Deltaproteobacteria bacterium]|nr:tetratricopeptide repeat protein [Deltaproteobacteria bacterium]